MSIQYGSPRRSTRAKSPEPQGFTTIGIPKDGPLAYHRNLRGVAIQPDVFPFDDIRTERNWPTFEPPNENTGVKFSELVVLCHTEPVTCFALHYLRPSALTLDNMTVRQNFVGRQQHARTEIGRIANLNNNFINCRFDYIWIIGNDRS